MPTSFGTGRILRTNEIVDTHCLCFFPNPTLNLPEDLGHPSFMILRASKNRDTQYTR